MLKPKEYRALPVVIEAIQYTGENGSAVLTFTGGDVAHEDLGVGGIVVSTIEGEMTAKPGWWIIKGVKGEFYPCDPEVFEATYEIVRKDPELYGAAWSSLGRKRTV